MEGNDHNWRQQASTWLINAFTMYLPALSNNAYKTSRLNVDSMTSMSAVHVFGACVLCNNFNSHLTLKTRPGRPSQVAR